MDITQIIQAIILGIVEGITEFLPISSTAHLIIGADMMGFNAVPGKVFEISIQLGAILAVVYKYWGKLTNVLVTLPKSKASQRFAANILLAFIPSVIVGVLFHDQIQDRFFNLQTIGITFILGGIVIILIETFVKKVKFKSVEDINIPTALKIGLFQVVSMIPGVSRSGATIMGSLMMGLDRKAAAEFTFFLAIPTMFAATVYDLYKNWNEMNADSFLILGIGFVTAFIAALFVVNNLIGFISKHGFKPFAYYRIVAGALILAFLA